MSNVEENILSAITIINDNDAEAVPPEQEELDAFNAYVNGEPDYQPYISHEKLVKNLVTE